MYQKKFGGELCPDPLWILNIPTAVGDGFATSVNELDWEVGWVRNGGERSGEKILDAREGGENKIPSLFYFTI